MDNTDFGGKTGTSNNYSDAWFVGTTPNLVCGVWVGGEYRSIHFTSGSQGQGSRTALPICGRFFEKVWGDSRLRPQVVAKYVGMRMDPSTYNCANIAEEEEEEEMPDSTFMAGDFEEEIDFNNLPEEDPVPVDAPDPVEPGTE